MSNAEQVKKFAILPEPFTVAAEELTVSMKLRRNVVVARYARQIEDLYRGGTPEVLRSLSLPLCRYIAVQVGLRRKADA